MVSGEGAPLLLLPAGYNGPRIERFRGSRFDRVKTADQGSDRAFRGLALVFVLTFVNLIGLILTVTALGGLGEWSRWQFAGLFGVIEASAGLSNILAPNIWHLPAAELNTSRRTSVRLAA